VQTAKTAQNLPAALVGQDTPLMFFFVLEKHELEKTANECSAWWLVLQHWHNITRSTLCIHLWGQPDKQDKPECTIDIHLSLQSSDVFIVYLLFFVVAFYLFVVEFLSPSTISVRYT